MEIFCQVLGVVAMMIGAVAFQMKGRRAILLLQILASCLFTVHYALLGAFTGAMMNVIVIMRNSVFCFKGKKWADSRVWLVVFLLLPVAACIAGWDGPVSLFSAGGMILQACGMWMKEPFYVRLLSFPGSMLWEVYNICIGSVGGILSSAANMLSIALAVVRIDLPALHGSKRKKHA